MYIFIYAYLPLFTAINMKKTEKEKRESETDFIILEAVA